MRRPNIYDLAADKCGLSRDEVKRFVHHVAYGGNTESLAKAVFPALPSAEALAAAEKVAKILDAEIRIHADDLERKALNHVK